MANSFPFRVVLDTNVIVSALTFGGKPRQITQSVIKRQLMAITSPILINELLEVLAVKFFYPQPILDLVEKKIKKYFQVVRPVKKIKILLDDPDNRVLEAAMAGNCQFIITGDKELLKLRSYRQIQIITPDKFLQLGVI